MTISIQALILFIFLLMQQPLGKYVARITIYSLTYIYYMYYVPIVHQLNKKNVFKSKYVYF